MEETKKTSKKNWEKVRELLGHHKDVLESLGVKDSDALYLPKMFYKPPGKEELHVSFFTSELQKGQDIYTEMVNRDYESEDPGRTLYKLEFNSHWKTQFEETTTPPVRYLVPISELVKIQPKTDSIEEETDCSGSDCSMDVMTMKDLLAIIQCEPISDKKWLNEEINKINKGKERAWTGPR